MKASRRNVEDKEKPRHTRMHRIRYEQNLPQQFINNLVPVNTCEQKDRFLRRKITPEFHLTIPTSELEAALLDASGNITFTLFREATRILNIVCKRFKSIDNFIEESFGPRISVEEATRKITEYINDSNLPTSLDVIWCDELAGSALMCSTGVDKCGNYPRHRKFTMLLKTNEENTYLREWGILNLMDHEIGTHYHRSYNEGLQPWYGKRDIYGLSPTSTNEAIKTEEGLACVHTILKARYRYLGVPALLYYGSCMAEYLPFKDLFEHLGKYMTDEEQRWKHCMRIKRCLPSQDLCGGYGKDQRYFEGAVTILRQQANIDFSLLMSGKLALGELDRVRRCVLTGAVRYPTFMQNRERYLATLRQIARLNGIPIAKCTQDRSRPRSLAISVDRKSSTDRVPTSFKETPRKTPMTIGSERSSRRSKRNSSSSEASGQSRKNPEKYRPRSCVEHIKTTSVASESSASETAEDERLLGDTEKRRTRNSENSSESSPHIADSKHPTDVKKSVQQNIISSLWNLELPTSQLCNVCEPQPDDPKVVFKSRRTAAGKEYFEDESVTLQNNMGSLPPGLCGCKLFTHGSWKQHTDSDPHLRKRAKSSSSIDEKSSNFSVPVILELDLRHPLIEV